MKQEEEPLTGLPENAFRELKPGEVYNPLMSPGKTYPEVNLWSVLWGVCMAVLFSAAAAYLGLKVGQVFEAAIPIAIIAVGLSTATKRKNSLGENVIIQSIGASSGVIVAGAIFTLPALYILQERYPAEVTVTFTQVFISSLLGGVLGILFLIPFRKYFVSDMHGKYPFPEATATTQILVSGQKGGDQAKPLLTAGLVGGLYDFITATFGLWNENFTTRICGFGEMLAEKAKLVFKVNTGAAVLGLGYIVGLKYAAIICFGSLFVWWVLIPGLSLVCGDMVLNQWNPDITQTVGAMSPEASICGLVFVHPDAFYPEIRGLQKKAAEDFLATVDRTTGDEISRITAAEEQKLAKLEEFNRAGTISQQQYENAKTQIMLEADTARQEELAKREKERQEKNQKGEDFMAQIMGQNAAELELLEIQEQQKLDVADRYREQNLINEEQYQAAVNAINDQYALKRANATGNAFGMMADNMKASLGEASAAYKAFAIAQATIATYTSAIEAYKSASAIPVIGWVMGPVAAAAAVAAGLANIGKIRSAREQGGNLAAGQLSTIAERNKPEVIMPAGASRVRTAEQMRQIMGENGNKSGGDSVTIVNNTTGRVDSAVTERDDEGRLRVIISETVSAALQDSNSAISKSRRATRNQPGY